jgi:hypothetical protein
MAFDASAKSDVVATDVSRKHGKECKSVKSTVTNHPILRVWQAIKGKQSTNDPMAAQQLKKLPAGNCSSLRPAWAP